MWCWAKLTTRPTHTPLRVTVHTAQCTQCHPVAGRAGGEQPRNSMLFNSGSECCTSPPHTISHQRSTLSLLCLVSVSQSILVQMTTVFQLVCECISDHLNLLTSERGSSLPGGIDPVSTLQVVCSHSQSSRWPGGHLDTRHWNVVCWQLIWLTLFSSQPRHT